MERRRVVLRGCRIRGSDECLMTNPGTPGKNDEARMKKSEIKNPKSEICS